MHNSKNNFELCSVFKRKTLHLLSTHSALAHLNIPHQAINQKHIKGSGKYNIRRFLMNPFRFSN